MGQKLSSAVTFEKIVTLAQCFAQRGTGLQRAVHHDGDPSRAVEVGIWAMAELRQGSMQRLRASAAGRASVA